VKFNDSTIVASLFLVVMFCPQAFCANASPPVHISPPVIREALDYELVRYVLPKGLALQIVFQTPLNTAFNQLNDPVEGLVINDLYLHEERLICKNTQLKGVITQLEKPIIGRNAILKLTFYDMVLDNGERIAIQAHVRTERGDNSWGGELTQGTKPLLSTQRVWGIGEYNRIVLGGPRSMGEEIRVEPGEHWIVILDKPAELVRPVEDNDNETQQY
jgi:hypothetical protein